MATEVTKQGPTKAKSERETFDESKLATLKDRLAKAPPAHHRMSKSEVIRRLQPTLRELRETKRYTVEQLVELLAKEGLSVKVSTLQSALKRRKGAGKVSKAKKYPGEAELKPATQAKKTTSVDPRG